VDGVLVWMVTPLRYEVWNIMYRYNRVKEHDDDKKQQEECEIIQKWITDHGRLETLTEAVCV
jgi:hypothetical protein